VTSPELALDAGTLTERVGVRGVTKSWGGVCAVDVDHWEIRSGEIHALAGENGAGKSTMLKIIAGIVTPDQGTIHIDNDEFTSLSPATAREHGIALVHQELAYAPLMPVAEAMALVAGYSTRRGLVRWREVYRSAQAKLDEWDLEVSAKAPMRDLTTAQKVAVSALAVTMRKPRVMILDEPTASLSAKEVEQMHALVRRLRDTGCAIAYVTHRLDEIFAICDRVTVMRNGRRIWTQPTADVTKPELIEAIAGRPIVKPSFEDLAGGDGAAPLLEVRDLTVGRFGPLSLTVRPGEIVALAGLVGSGRSELLEGIYGTRHASSGSVVADGHEGPFRNPREAIAAKIGMVPEERRVAGLVMDMSVRENMVLTSAGRYSRRLSRLLRRRKQRADVTEMARRVNLKSASIDVPVRTLSGGNQQKVLLGRWLLSSPNVLILDEPTRGVDVGAREEIFDLVRDAAREGRGIVITSSDFEDLEGLANRAIVLQEGNVVGELHGARITADRILDLCFQQAT
jgi:ribose transport system ATP-binding protein